MYIDMACGKCDSAFVLDADEDESAAWVLLNRFCDAHVACGFMAPNLGQEPAVEVVQKRIVRKPRLDETEEES